MRENNWEKKFDKKFFRFQEMGVVENSDEIKPFISKLIAEQRAEAVKEFVDWCKEQNEKPTILGMPEFSKALNTYLDGSLKEYLDETKVVK